MYFYNYIKKRTTGTTVTTNYEKLIEINDLMMPKYVQMAKERGISLNKLIGLLLAKELKEYNARENNAR